MDEKIKPIKINADKCNGCAACVLICPKNCFKMEWRNGGSLEQYAVVDTTNCIGCKKCFSKCSGAIKIEV